ncbi:hypothetical protein MD484_g1327, partial [Candolleomyces efflorescens]
MDASNFLLVLRVVQDQGYSRAAALTFLIYDILSLLEDEIELVWRKKWSFMKVLYLIERYYGLGAIIIMIIVYLIRLDSCTSALTTRITRPTTELTYPTSCSTYIRAMSLAGSKFCVVVIDTICIIRIYALYESNKKVLAVLVSIALCEFTFGFYAIWQLTEFETAAPRSSDPLLARAGCLTLAAEVTPLKLRMYLANCVFTTANSGLYFLLSLYKLRVYLVDRSSGRVRLPLLMKMSVISPLLRAFFRDAALTFLLAHGSFSISVAQQLAKDLEYVAWIQVAWHTLTDSAFLQSNLQKSQL